MIKYKNVSGIIIGILISFVTLPATVLPLIFGKGDAYAIALSIFFGVFVILGFGLTIKELITSYIIDEKGISKLMLGRVIQYISKNDIKDIVLVKTKRTESLWCTVHILQYGIDDNIVNRVKSKITVTGKNIFLSKQKNVISIHLTIKVFLLMEKYGYYVKTII